MSGRVLKITIEDTHPPIWRRIIVPERITFEDLHEIIQILFGWEGDHLHCFENYSHGFYAGCQEDHMTDIPENQILVDDYIELLPWIRYTYDFGDNWNHKIVFEKKDPSYGLRSVSLVKYKGDNPEEDCGGAGPWMEFSKFDPADVTMRLNNLKIPAREINTMPASSEQHYDDAFEYIFNQFREENPEFNNITNRELMDIFRNAFMESIEEGGLHENMYYTKDEELQRQLKLLECDQLITIVQSKKTLRKHLEEIGEQTIEDYIRYSCLELSRQNIPTVVLAEFILENVEILYYFFCQDELKDLLDFWDSYCAGQTMLEEQFLPAMAKSSMLGLIRLTGKRKIKLELCAEFGQIMDMIDRAHLNKVYAQVGRTVKTTGALLMAYTAMTFDLFYQMYSKYAKTPMDRKEYERFLYWNGTMNGAITTCKNSATGEKYLFLPGMKEHLEDLLRDNDTKLFKTTPRIIPDTEFKRWLKGLNVAIPEWDAFGSGQDDAFIDELIFESYKLISSGRSLTDMILDDLTGIKLSKKDHQDTEGLLGMESDLWNHYGRLCLVTPIMGMNGYSRLQYAEKFQEALDYIPLFNDHVLKRRITKDTHIYEFPRDIQLELLEAMMRGEDEYERAIIRLSRKYTSNQALRMELAILNSEKIYEKYPDFDERMEEQNNIYPWLEDEYFLPKVETFVRETKKVGRNDPCPCGSGRKYKHCCGKS